MAGRNRMPRHPADVHGFCDGERINVIRGPGPRIHPEALEEEIEIQCRENQRIVVENRHLMDGNVLLERELLAAKDDILRLHELVMKLQTDKDSKTRGLFERSMKLEADLRVTEPLREEVLQLRAEAKKLNVLRQDLTAQVQGLNQDMFRLQSENKQFSALRADVVRIRKELTDARRTLEYEKKSNEEQIERKQGMEKTLMAMALEVEQLRAEHLMDRRLHGLGGSSYGLYNTSPDMRYPTGAFTDGRDGYGGAWGTYSKRPRH